MRWVIAFVTILFPLAALAAGTSTTSTTTVNPDAVDTVGEGFELLKLAYNAFKGGGWALGAGLLLTGAIALLRVFKVGQKIPKAYLPWFVGGVAMLTSIALGLQVGLGWQAIVTTGLSVGLMAMGGWSTFGKAVKALMKKIWPKGHDMIFGKNETTPPPDPPKEKA